MTGDARGVEWRVGAADDGIRLDRFLAAASRLGSRGRARDALGRGRVFVNDREAGAGDGGVVLTPRDRVRYWEDRPGSARIAAAGSRSRGLRIVYEDAALVVVDKPPGLLVVPLGARPDAPTLEDALVEHLRSRGKVRPQVVHRIDRDTSGLVVFAKTPAARAALKLQFEHRTAERTYLAVVYGQPAPEAGTWRNRLRWDARERMQIDTGHGDRRAADAVSHYRVVRRLSSASLVEVRLESGRRNQIRIQAALHGCPLVGERQYVADGDWPAVPFPRQALHAWRLALDHPVTRRRMRFEAPVPRDLEALITRLARHQSARSASLHQAGRRVRPGEDS
jgi:23S rRNA pseudouridine1911/1915/1917 synthase